jgi:hypothetical protein
MANLITVKAANEDGRVVVWEKHPDHPTGEIFISGNGRTHKVARTVKVQQLLKVGELVEVKAEAKPPVNTPPADERVVVQESNVTVVERPAGRGRKSNEG